VLEGLPSDPDRERHRDGRTRTASVMPSRAPLIRIGRSRVGTPANASALIQFAVSMSWEGQVSRQKSGEHLYHSDNSGNVGDQSRHLSAKSQPAWLIEARPEGAVKFDATAPTKRERGKDRS
jgi:hypothetical protein